MPRSRADIEIIRAYGDRDDIAKKLIVRMVDDELVVDALEVMITEHDVRYWYLEPNGSEWLHVPTGTCMSLYDHLCSIAAVYVFDVNNPRHVGSLVARHAEVTP